MLVLHKGGFFRRYAVVTKYPISGYDGATADYCMNIDAALEKAAWLTSYSSAEHHVFIWNRLHSVWLKVFEL